MKKQDPFYSKIFLLYLLIFISFLMKSFAATSFLRMPIALSTNEHISTIQDFFHYPLAPHQAR